MKTLSQQISNDLKRGISIHARLIRKSARTAIYTAVFGPQGLDLSTPIRRTAFRSNEPWSDKSRLRPEGWSAQHAFETFKQHSKDAALPRVALIEIASTLGVDSKELMKS